MAIETTSRRFDSIIRRLAIGSPFSICFASVTSSAAVSSLWRPTSARKSCRLSAAPVSTRTGRTRARRAPAARAALVPPARRADLETDSLELARELLDLVLVEVVLERERLELGGLDVAALSRLPRREGARPSDSKLVKLLVRQVIVELPLWIRSLSAVGFPALVGVLSFTFRTLGPFSSDFQG